MYGPLKKRNNERICKDKIDNFLINSFLNSQRQVILKAQCRTFHNFVHAPVCAHIFNFWFYIW